jgi:spermidine synthase
MGQKHTDHISLRTAADRRDQTLDLWFQDSVEFDHGCRLSIRIKDVLCRYRSKLQEIAILETEHLGKIFVLDGITMLTEFDEFAYHEMIAHVPMLTHPRPESILIIGGGDGGTLREILKHREVKKVDICEIDPEVVKTCRKFLPNLASCFDDSRAQLFYEDGARFVKEHAGAYDLIIVDSTDPIGPGQILFQRQFYEDMRKALTDNGIAVTQCESIYLHKEVIRGVFSFAQDLFPHVRYYYTLTPTYPSGTIGFLFCSLKYDPLKDISEKKAARLTNLKYYTPEVHKSAFCLPRFAERLFERS